MPKEVLKDLRFVFVSHMDEVLDVALTRALPQRLQGEMRTHQALRSKPLSC